MVFENKPKQVSNIINVAMISTKFIRFSFDKLARTHKIARSFSPRVLVPKPVPTGSAYVTHAPQEPHFGSDINFVIISKQITHHNPAIENGQFKH